MGIHSHKAAGKLRNLGYEVEEASSGQEALDKLQNPPLPAAGLLQSDRSEKLIRRYSTRQARH